jgi:pyruvate dehydrogenase E1 component alpha subunit
MTKSNNNLLNFANSYEKLFYEALRIRLVEERIVQIYPSDKIQSPVHLSIGQEAVAVGICQPLKRSDLVFGSYRGHAFYLAKGGDLNQMFAELYGKSTGCSGGKGGSMHLAAPGVGFMGSSAVVTSTIPHAVGAALAAKLNSRDQVIVSVFGDGATEEGGYHESLNLANLKKVPVIFVCENNGLAVHSKVEARQSYKICEQAESYGMSTNSIEDGSDFVHIANVFEDIVKTVRANQCPSFLEVKTFRYKEHVGPNEDYDAGYRDRSELVNWMKKDPLILDDALYQRFAPSINQEIEEAVQYAEASPWPDDSQLYTDVL